MKLAWRLIQNSNNLWVKILRDKYHFNRTTYKFETSKSIYSSKGK